MKKILGIIALVTATSTGAMAANVTPYVGLGLVIDKAGTSAKRVGFNPNNIAINPGTVTGKPDIPAIMGDAVGGAIVRDGGGDMKFDAAIAGEITAGIKWGHIRAELEAAFRSASEDKYNIFDGQFNIPIPTMNPNVIANIETATEVTHNSYMANFYYDFEIQDSNWEPYVGFGLGIGTYKQKATVDVTGEVTVKLTSLSIPLDQHMTVLEENKTEFEWQVALGTAYHFTDNWAADIAYRFNSSTIAGEFVYAHELKVGARYSF